MREEAIVSEQVEIIGGAGPYETAAIVAAVSAMLVEIAQAGAQPPDPHAGWAAPAMRGVPEVQSWSPVRPSRRTSPDLER